MLAAMKIEGYCSAPEVLSRLGIGATTLGRWLNDPSVRFPRPVKVKGHRYFSIAAVDAWLASFDAGRNIEAAGLPEKALTGPITEYSDLVAALRSRRQELGLSHMEVEHVSGLQGGYVSKIEAGAGKNHARTLGCVSLPLMLGALGCALQLVETTDRTKLRGVKKAMQHA